MSTIESENIEKRPEDRGQNAPSAVEGASNPSEKKNSKSSTLDDDLSFLNSLPVIGKPEKKSAVIDGPRHSEPERTPQPPVGIPPSVPKADQKETVRPAPPAVKPAPVVKEFDKPRKTAGKARHLRSREHPTRPKKRIQNSARLMTISPF